MEKAGQKPAFLGAKKLKKSTYLSIFENQAREGWGLKTLQGKPRNLANSSQIWTFPVLADFRRISAGKSTFLPAGPGQIRPDFGQLSGPKSCARLG